MLEAYGKLPLAFEANRGQTDSRVKFLSRGRGYTVFLTSTEAVLALQQPSRVSNTRSNIDRVAGRESSASSVLRMKLMGAQAPTTIEGLKELTGKSNYFIGNDSTKWLTQVPTYAQVRYQNAYPGIDLVYYGHQGQLEFDFVVAPSASATAIRLAIEGTDAPVQIDRQGDLVVTLDGGQVCFHKPMVYQPAGAGRAPVDGRFVLKSAHEVGFEIAGVDPTRPVVIDPTLSYSTYIGGRNDNFGSGIAVDSAGNAYVTGHTNSPDFPTKNAFQPTLEEGYEAFVVALDPTGSTLRYATYLGGHGEVDIGSGIAVDSAGNAYVTGFTDSADFPTKNAFQPRSHGLPDAFVAALDPTGSSLRYSTYLGGSSGELGLGIAVDSAGNAYVTGITSSTDFPTKNAFQPTYHGRTDAFVAALDPTGSSLRYATYLGGSDTENVLAGDGGIAVDGAGNAYVTGSTESTDFPTQNPLQPTNHGSGDVFVAALDPTGSTLRYATFLGGSGFDRGRGIGVDKAGNAYVTGTTDSTNFPTQNPLRPTNHGSGDAFVAALDPTGSSLRYSTYLGGSGADSGNGIAVDSAGNAYVTGNTSSTDFPTQNPLQPTNHGAPDAFVAALDPTGSSLRYSTYLGGSGAEGGNGIAADRLGNAYVTGNTTSTDFPTQNPLQPTKHGTADAFVVKIASGYLRRLRH